jgi:phosphate transport system ATP-binding protein
MSFPIEISVNRLNFFYSKTHQALKNIQIEIYKNSVTTFIGPSGSGKSTLLRCFNRLHDLYHDTSYEGQIFFKEKNILSSQTDTAHLRQQIGMVFQTPAAFPMSIFDNIAYGLKLHGSYSKADLRNLVESGLRKAALWNEVKDILSSEASKLSIGQQQRLALARALALDSEVLLLDEPTASLDPSNTSIIEELIQEIKKEKTIILVTHNISQAKRLSDRAALLLDGQLIEVSTTLFSTPQSKLTEDFLNGRIR